MVKAVPSMHMDEELERSTWTKSKRMDEEHGLWMKTTLSDEDGNKYMLVIRAASGWRL